MANKKSTEKRAAKAAPDDSRSKGGRPRNRPSVKSRPRSGVGGRKITWGELKQIVHFANEFDVDRAVRRTLCQRIWAAHGTYLASENANGKQVGAKAEAEDVRLLVERATAVKSLLFRYPSEVDASQCISSAGDFAESMRNFPNMHEAEASAVLNKAGMLAFMGAIVRLAETVVYVQRWADHRQQHANDIDLVLSVCAKIPAPKRFTKRHRSARNEFDRELRRIYLDLVHPARRALWENAGYRRGSGDPPPPESVRRFSQQIMWILGVRFQVNSSK